MTIINDYLNVTVLLLNCTHSQKDLFIIGPVLGSQSFRLNQRFWSVVVCWLRFIMYHSLYLVYFFVFCYKIFTLRSMPTEKWQISLGVDTKIQSLSIGTAGVKVQRQLSDVHSGQDRSSGIGRCVWYTARRRYDVTAGTEAVYFGGQALRSGTIFLITHVVTKLFRPHGRSGLSLPFSPRLYEVSNS